MEVHLGNGLPQFQIVGLPDTEVRESRERVRVALQASGFEFPQRRITVNLAPADLPKRSGHFDLPMALGLLLASGQLPPQRAVGLECAGELALDGRLRPVRGALAMAGAVASGGQKLLLPADHAPILCAFGFTHTFVASTLAMVGEWMKGERPDLALRPVAPADPGPESLDLQFSKSDGTLIPDLADVRGQQQARHALEVAAAGGHSLVLHGPPGCGKTLLAERLPGLLPDLTPAEALACAVQRSLAGLPIDLPRRHLRPFRRPHHTTPVKAMIGGGHPLRPGEVTLAHHGVLLLDELPEFSRPSLEALREPLQSGEVHVSRVYASARYPARFQLVATMNPCPCGRSGAMVPPCACTPARIRAYRALLSQPLLDRIDLWVPLLPLADASDRAHPGGVSPASAPASAPVSTSASAPESTATVRVRVLQARARQAARQGCLNAHLDAGALRHTLGQAPDLAAAWERCEQGLHLSARGAIRLLAVARTLADLAGQEAVAVDDLYQAAGWRRMF